MRADERPVSARVRIPDGAPLRTSAYPGVARRAVALLPGLRRHVCRNPDGTDILDELADTEVAHLCEHVVLELMALAGAPRRLEGRTRWDFARTGRGVFDVEIAYEDGAASARALTAGVEVARRLLEREPVEDLDAIVAAVRGAPCRSGTPGATFPESSTDER